MSDLCSLLATESQQTSAAYGCVSTIEMMVHNIICHRPASRVLLSGYLSNASGASCLATVSVKCHH